jgi:hypothetical protein
VKSAGFLGKEKMERISGQWQTGMDKSIQCRIAPRDFTEALATSLYNSGIAPMD